MHNFFARLIDAFRPADGPPPRTLLAFFRWCLSGAWPGLMIAAVTSALSGIADIISAVMLGWVIDAVTTTTLTRSTALPISCLDQSEMRSEQSCKLMAAMAVVMARFST